MECDRAHYHVNFWTAFWVLVGIVFLFIIAATWNEVFVLWVTRLMGRPVNATDMLIIAIVLTVIFMLLAGCMYRWLF